MSSTTSRPRVLLFDIGGVCVVSPFQAILDYEKAQKIPLGWINHSIAASNPDGAWQQLERGEAKLDAPWFAAFKADLSNEQRWRKYYAQYLAKSRKQDAGAAAEEAVFNAPPVPDIDAEWLFWEMMRVARQPDPHMYPALKRLRQHADKHPGSLVLAALSNTSIFPAGHPFAEETAGHADVKRQFHVFVSSAHVGMRKPAENIYYYTIGRVSEFVVQRGYGDGVRAQDFIFLDDIGSNLKTAKKIGMGTIKVDLGRADRAVKELETRTGITVTSDGGSSARL
ncbi:hypothetical protein AMS68_001529 [Peltaster fructicola]|uniref:Uncharacterized protein n=1 Tax=Peltaster fructicola TaxID=286661 RepID=A0A6H0XMM8_9PEZI|nr:hypothetical protein AMS68_001529 [Peltaster fructicola]